MIQIISNYSFLSSYNIFISFKKERESDINVLSVNAEDQERLNKVWANLDNPFKSNGFLKFLVNDKSA